MDIQTYFLFTCVFFILGILILFRLRICNFYSMTVRPLIVLILKKILSLGKEQRKKETIVTNLMQSQVQLKRNCFL